MDVTGLKRPNKKKQAAKKQPEKVVPMPSSNLHQPVRGEKVARQFKLPADMSAEFDIAASERGYNRRQGSEFFQEIWEFWKANN